MEISKLVLLGIYSAIVLYFVYRLFFKKSPFRAEYEKLYNGILNSDKHKVKGQWSDRGK